MSDYTQETDLSLKEAIVGFLNRRERLGEIIQTAQEQVDKTDVILRKLMALAKERGEEGFIRSDREITSRLPEELLRELWDIPVEVWKCPLQEFLHGEGWLRRAREKLIIEGGFKTLGPVLLLRPEELQKIRGLNLSCLDALITRLNERGLLHLALFRPRVY